MQNTQRNIVYNISICNLGLISLHTFMQFENPSGITCPLCSSFNKLRFSKCYFSHHMQNNTLLDCISVYSSCWKQTGLSNTQSLIPALGVAYLHVLYLDKQCHAASIEPAAPIPQKNHWQDYATVQTHKQF